MEKNKINNLLMNNKFDNQKLKKMKQINKINKLLCNKKYNNKKLKKMQEINKKKNKSQTKYNNYKFKIIIRKQNLIKK